MYSSIVVGTDGSASSRDAVQHAATLARATGATLHIVHAYRLPSTAMMAAPEMATLVAGADGDAADAARSLVDGIADKLEADGITVERHTVGAPAADAICMVADKAGADVVVVGNKGMKGARRVLGSVPNSVAHHASCAVLIVPTC